MATALADHGAPTVEYGMHSDVTYVYFLKSKLKRMCVS